MSETLIYHTVIGIATVIGSWATMRTQVAQTREDVAELKNDVKKVSLQVAFMNGQLAQRGLSLHTMPDTIKAP